MESGTPLTEIDTPFLMVDLDVVERNIETLFSKFRGRNVAIRPHLKTVKSPEFAKLFLAAGAVGVCVAKAAEAEIMAAAGIEDILITTEIIGTPKLNRLTKLVAKHPEVKVVVDSVEGITAMLECAQTAKTRLKILLELNVGQNRAGVEPGQPALELANEIAKHKEIKLAGIQGYEGHLQLLLDEDERKHQCLASMEKLMSTVKLLRENGHKIPIVTTGGTGTSEYCADAGATEIQPGSFVFMDGAYFRAIGNKYEQALSLVATVISKPAQNRCVIDAGLKSLSTDSGMADCKSFPDLAYRAAGDEHGILELLEANPPNKFPLAIGDRIEMRPSHIDTTVNLHDFYFCHRNGIIENVWPISARGKVQ